MPATRPRLVSRRRGIAGFAAHRTTGLIHPYQNRHLTISEIKALSSFPAEFRIEGRFIDKWARVGNSVLPLLMRAVAAHIRDNLLTKNPSAR